MFRSSKFHGACHKCGQTGHSKKFCTKAQSMVACHDCGAMVRDLMQHRGSVCPNSRRARSRVSAPIVTNQAMGMVVGEGVGPIGGQMTAGTTDWYALIDVSGSMLGERLAKAKEALLHDIAPAMAENDRMAIVTFDSQAFFKLKPRAVGQLRRQNELPALLERIFAQGSTALWDAVYLAISQIQDATRRTVLTVLTDGEDNASTHTYAEILDLLARHPNVELSIVHIGCSPSPQYTEVARRARGVYRLIGADELRVTFTATFMGAYLAQRGAANATAILSTLLAPPTGAANVTITTYA